ncbi:hypothetical protein OK016_10080 [Vibrio chagasii]|nr:hypothetical protein [Vibrio chagasii]
MKDYIAVPKANGYQSLHTSMIETTGCQLRFRSVLEDMDQMADKGVAAHWSYKGNGSRSSNGTTAQVKAQRWMQSLLELQQSAVTHSNSLKTLSLICSQMIFVFTPKGRIVELLGWRNSGRFWLMRYIPMSATCV